jgi:hypothetical protein
MTNVTLLEFFCGKAEMENDFMSVSPLDVATHNRTQSGCWMLAGKRSSHLLCKLNKRSCGTKGRHFYKQSLFCDFTESQNSDTVTS